MGWMTRFGFLAGAGFPLLATTSVSGLEPTRQGYFPWGIAVGCWNWPLHLVSKLRLL